MDTYVGSSVSQSSLKISWAPMLNHISSVSNSRINGNCPFQSKSQASWLESWKETRNIWGLSPSFWYSIRTQALNAFLGAHLPDGQCSLSHSSPNLSNTLLPEPATPQVPRMTQEHTRNTLCFSKGQRGSPSPSFAHPKKDDLQKKMIQVHKGSTLCCSPINFLFLLLIRLKHKI